MIYSSYAPIYEAIGQGAFAAALMRRLLSEGALPAQMLDLACGTGAASLVCAAAGSIVTGIDRSAEMLAIAREKAQYLGYPIAFHQGDMRQASALPLKPASYDLAVCLYDSLNYLLADGDLHAVCAGVSALLRPGGRFIFDLNTHNEMLGWADYDQVVYDDENYLVFNRLDYDEQVKRGRARIVWFARQGQRWQRGEELHIERAWGDAEVRAALEATGLRLMQRLTPELALAGPEAPRIVYSAMQP
ncbi:class I SAM-dependent methyltransferase [Candidatus Gracilibacteria bacterium]|nr:class I SAM-dependent methyltransferase [Candidatus Gracilibacteria bacterium]